MSVSHAVSQVLVHTNMQIKAVQKLSIGYYHNYSSLLIACVVVEDHHALMS